MLQSIDHIVILVNDLEQAQADYKAVGFLVVPGGEHSDGTTHNALVAFADGTYLELIAFKKPNPAHRWWQYQAIGEGLIDFALLPGDIVGDIAAARSRGLELQGPLPGGRLRPDGQEISWQTAMATSRDLPFLCGDVTSRALRVPGAASHQHPNGATSIIQLGVVVSNLEASTARYQALLGSSPQPSASDKTATFRLGSATIALTQPTNDPVLNAYLDRHGEGAVSLQLRVDAASSQLSLDSGRTHTTFPIILS